MVTATSWDSKSNVTDSFMLQNTIQELQGSRHEQTHCFSQDKDQEQHLNIHAVNAKLNHTGCNY